MAAKIWTTWELMTAHLIPNEANIKKGEDDTFNLVCISYMPEYDFLLWYKRNCIFYYGTYEMHK